MNEFCICLYLLVDPINIKQKDHIKNTLAIKAKKNGFGGSLTPCNKKDAPQKGSHERYPPVDQHSHIKSS